MGHWYALRTTTGRETSVAVHLAERRLTFFLPMQTDWNGDAKHMTPLLPGYVFVRCGLEEIATLIGLEGVIQAVRYVRDDGELWPIPFPDVVILGLQIEERAGTFDFTRLAIAPKYRPRKGETVRITAGPYFDFVATVLAAPRAGRCKLLIQHETFEAPRKKTLDVGHLTAA